MEKGAKIHLRLDRETTDRFLQIKNYLGLKNDTEVCRVAINYYWRDHQEQFQLKLEHFNLNEHGVLILDRELQGIFQVFFNPDAILCEHCVTKNCRHIKFALSIPAVQEILRKKGWKPK